jgi:hypothetical protein
MAAKRATGNGKRETELSGAIISFGLLGRNLFGQDRPPYAHCGYQKTGLVASGTASRRIDLQVIFSF